MGFRVWGLGWRRTVLSALALHTVAPAATSSDVIESVCPTRVSVHAALSDTVYSLISFRRPTPPQKSGNQSASQSVSQLFRQAVSRYVQRGCQCTRPGRLIEACNFGTTHNLSRYLMEAELKTMVNMLFWAYNNDKSGQIMSSSEMRLRDVVHVRS